MTIRKVGGQEGYTRTKGEKPGAGASPPQTEAVHAAAQEGLPGGGQGSEEAPPSSFEVWLTGREPQQC